VKLQVHIFVLGPLATNCYLLRWGKECWVVDPSLWPEELLKFLRTAGAAPGRILLTHGHGDHIAGVGALKAAYPAARLCCPAADAGMLTDPVANVSATFGLSLSSPPADELLRPGQTLEAGGLTWQVLDTSGHTPGGVSFHCAEAGVVLTGDALFDQGIGRTDIPGADEERLLANIRGNLLTLPEGTRVLPGHGAETTIGEQRTNNPFLRGV